MQAPKANAFCERLIGTVRRECLDYMIPLGEKHLRRILREWVTRFSVLSFAIATEWRKLTPKLRKAPQAPLSHPGAAPADSDPAKKPPLVEPSGTGLLLLALTFAVRRWPRRRARDCALSRDCS